MKNAKAPVRLTNVTSERNLAGAIMCDQDGYFYRPKKTVIGKAAHDPKWDGKHFVTFDLCMNSVLFGDE